MSKSCSDLCTHLGNEAQHIYDQVVEMLSINDGFEIYPFKIGNYNASVLPTFRLPYENDTMALLVLSTPRMFEYSFKLWLQNECHGCSFDSLPDLYPDPLSMFMNSRISHTLASTTIVSYHDFDLWPNRRPKILMCTCGHVSGAAYYYRPTDLVENPWINRPIESGNTNIIGVSLHPKFGGWFAFRAVLIFPKILLPKLFQPPEPLKTLQSDDAVKEAIELFNFNWKDARFRDCGNTGEKYCNVQTDYFSTIPKERWQLISHWFP